MVCFCVFLLCVVCFCVPFAGPLLVFLCHYITVPKRSVATRGELDVCKSNAANFFVDNFLRVLRQFVPVTSTCSRHETYLLVRHNVFLTHDSRSIKIWNVIWVYWQLKILEDLGTNILLMVYICSSSSAFSFRFGVHDRSQDRPTQRPFVQSRV